MSKNTTEDPTANNIWKAIDKLQAEYDEPKISAAIKISKTNGPKLPPVPVMDPHRYINPPTSEEMYNALLSIAGLVKKTQPQQNTEGFDQASPGSTPKMRSYQKFSSHISTPKDLENKDIANELRAHVAKDIQEIITQPTLEEQKRAEKYAAWQAMFLDIQNLPPKPPAALRQGDHYLFTLGELFVVAGKAKSRKTFATAGLITAALARSGAPDGLQNQLFGNLPADRPKVVYIDTEQSAYHTGQAFKRAVSLCGERYAKNLQFAHANGKSPAELISCLRAALQSDQTISAVIIDNGGDLLASGANDEAPSKALAKELNEIAQQFCIALGIVVHTARTSIEDDIAGHLGSQLAQRCSWHARVAVVDPKTKEGRALSTLDHVRNRWQAPDQGLTFKIEDGIPVLVEYQNALTKRQSAEVEAAKLGRPPQIQAEDIDIKTHMEIWEGLWRDANKKKEQQLGKSDLYARLRLAMSKWGKGTMGTRCLDKFIALALDEDLCQKIGNKYAAPA
jgi:uncharacterized protein YbaR (Trm112 family)